MPSEEKCFAVRIGVLVKVRVSWGVGGGRGGGGETRQLSPKRIVPQLGLWFGLDLVLGLGGNSPQGQLS